MFVSSMAWLALGSLLFSITSASPTRITKKSNLLPFRPKSQHSKRATSNIGNIPEDFLPACDERYDPSYAKDPSKYQDGQGYALNSLCDNGLEGNNKCWTDTTSSDCAQKTISLNQTCTKNKITKEGNTKSTFELKLPEWFEGFSPGFTFLESTVAENLATTQICTKTTSEGGYQRRTCTTGRVGVNVPACSQLRALDGLYTVGMQDFNIEIPEATVLGCGAPCDAVAYPGPPPAEPQTVTPVLG
ncbi:MAG: hypothetical protein Q9208_002133 [Pyrenodesmia sp. 3 TL-2023]